MMVRKRGVLDGENVVRWWWNAGCKHHDFRSQKYATFQHFIFSSPVRCQILPRPGSLLSRD
jgi:hypothetical protein